MSVPEKMRALQVVELGENYKGVGLHEIAVPKPDKGEILLKIRAGSLGFPDLLMTQGGYQHKPDLPFIPGGDVSAASAQHGPLTARLDLQPRRHSDGSIITRPTTRRSSISANALRQSSRL